MDFTPMFKQYETLIQQIEGLFTRVQQQHPECVMCQPGCADCCHAIFDLTLIEALYLKAHFDQRFTGPEREAILERANTADRALVRLKRRAYQEHQGGKPEAEILADMAVERVRCPLLDEADHCVMYDIRPITCRLYGIPTQIGERAHSCHLSKFAAGESYPTVKMDAIHQKLYGLSASLAQAIQSRFSGLAEILLPVSMALLTDFTEEYLGVKSGEASAEQK